MNVTGQDTKVAAWGIFDCWNKRIAKLPFKAKDQAEELLAKLNSNLERANEPHHLRLIKETLFELESQLAMVIPTRRRVQGVNEDRQTLERRMWSKIFIDLETTTVTIGNFLLVETFTVHRYRGELRVHTPGEGSLDYNGFESFAKRRWPTSWQRLMIHVDLTD